MANRYFNDKANVIGGGRVCIMGSFAPNGASAVDPTQTKGRGFTVARTGAGVFTISFDDIFVDFLAFDASVQLSAIADLKAQFGAFTVGTATTKSTLVLNILAVAVATDIAANAQNRVHFRAWFRKSTAI